MIAYFDSSALLKLFLPESGSAEVRRVWTSGIRRTTSRVAHAELACALGAQAELIVSGDRHLLDLQEHQGIRIVTAVEAVGILGSIAL